MSRHRGATQEVMDEIYNYGCLDKALADGFRITIKRDCLDKTTIIILYKAFREIRTVIIDNALLDSNSVIGDKILEMIGGFK